MSCRAHSWGRVVALLALAACHHKTEAPEPAPEPAPAPVEAPAAAPVPQPAAPTGPQPWGDDYTIMGSVSLKGLAMTIDVRYGGGCQDHEFTTRPGPRTADAPTVQPVVLYHEAHDDTCRALKYEHLTIPLDDLIGADCTETLLLVAPSEDGKGQRLLPLSKPMGCD